MIPWSEEMIAHALATQFFERKHIVLVPNCNWTGYECDLLVVSRDLRVIDVEIKISRADLKADAKKSKWWQSLTWQEKEDAGLKAGSADWWDAKTARRWPHKVWKHYYAMPAEIWKPELAESMPSTSSGILLLKQLGSPHPRVTVTCQRRATPDRNASTISAEAAVDIARLANIRMWSAIGRQKHEAAA